MTKRSDSREHGIIAGVEKGREFPLLSRWLAAFDEMDAGEYACPHSSGAAARGGFRGNAERCQLRSCYQAHLGVGGRKEVVTVS